MHVAIIFYLLFYTQFYSKTKLYVFEIKQTKNALNLKQEDVDKSVNELYEELNEAKDKVCEQMQHFLYQQQK